MLPTKLIKKGCIISFISLLLLAALLYFVVYKTLVLESFEDEDGAVPTTREWGRTVLDAGQLSGVGGQEGNVPAFEAALKFGKESITGNECGNGTKTDIQQLSCSTIDNENECNTMMRVKKKYKGREAHAHITDFDGFEAAGLTGNGTNYDLNGLHNDVEYKLNYNVYPCKWTAAEGCTNDLHNRCVFMGERDSDENPDGWTADMKKTDNADPPTQSYTYSDIREAIRCAATPTPAGCPGDNNQA